MLTVLPDALDEVDAFLTADHAAHLQALETELQGRLSTALGLDPAGAGDLATLSFDPASGGTGGGTLHLLLHLGDSGSATQPFNLDFDIPGGVAGTEAGGTLTVDYGADVTLALEVELPSDPAAAGAAPTVVVDTDHTGVTANVTTDLQPADHTTLTANLGPAEVSLGSLDPDGDPTTNDADPVVAHLAANVDLSNAIGPVAVDALGTWLSGLLPDPTTDPGAFDGAGGDCGITPPPDVPACAHLPVYLTSTATPQLLGDIDVTAPHLLDPSGWQFDGAQGVIDNLASGEFLWSMLADGFQALAGSFAETLRSSSYGLDLPLIGDQLDGGAAIADQVDALSAQIATLAEELGPLASDELQGHITDRRLELPGPLPARRS